MLAEWEGRLAMWINALSREFYEPLGDIPLEGFVTKDMLDPDDAENGTFSPMPVGTVWGKTWEYCWMRGDFTLPEAAAGKQIVMNLNQGGEATLFVNGEAFGTRRAEWVKEKHHYFSDQVITRCAVPGEKIHLLIEAYAGHDFPRNEIGKETLGPMIEGDGNTYSVRPQDELRQTVGQCTFGIWHEEAYQLWKDVTTLDDLRKVLDPTSLRLAEVEEALEQFTLNVDFEQPRNERLKDYVRARELLKPSMEAHNGSTAPQFYAIGNAHIDICWLWPYRETQRKVARTFAAQIRLMDMYPEYKFVQSQPEAYMMCKQLYPKLYERIKEKVKTGQWIPDGSMWVEPDTNMASGEALVRQLLLGKRFYKDEFGVDCQLLWLPDTFGYSAVLPQLLRGAGVKYLTTQKIFWSYNDCDRFPYHYFTWQGMDGSEVTSFLHMDYTSRTSADVVANRWRDRVQKRDITRFLLPFGYGDGGGGPTRDDLENLRREKDLEGVPQVRVEAPQTFFEDCARDGAPKNRYVGELYFQAHRGTFTSQAAIKNGNRRSELGLREAEIWSAAAAPSLPYPAEKLDDLWKKALRNQFHDILPGSSIERVYMEARALYDEILKGAAEITGKAVSALTAGEGKTWFNSLSWERREIVPIDGGYAMVTVPPMGWTSQVSTDLPCQPVSVCLEDDGCVCLKNGIVTVVLNKLGEIVSCTDSKGRSRIGMAGNVLKLYEDTPRAYEAWDLDSCYENCPVDAGSEGTITIVENNPFCCTAEVRRVVGSSPMVQRISLKADSARLDLVTDIDWQEQHRVLKADFATAIRADEAINEIQFGYVKHPTHRSRKYDSDRYEVCNHRYTALCDENRGAAVLNDCKYGVSMLGDTISLTLLRSPKSPDRNADMGHHHFTYSYYIWDGSLMNSNVQREATQLNQPLTTADGAADTFSLMSIDAPNVIIDTVKQAQDGSGDLIIRLYECKHAHTDAELSLNIPTAEACLCNLMEEEQEGCELKDGKVQLHFHVFEVKTLRVKLA